MKKYAKTFEAYNNTKHDTDEVFGMYAYILSDRDIKDMLEDIADLETDNRVVAYETYMYVDGNEEYIRYFLYRAKNSELKNPKKGAYQTIVLNTNIKGMAYTHKMKTTEQQFKTWNDGYKYISDILRLIEIDDKKPEISEIKIDKK